MILARFCVPHVVQPCRTDSFEVVFCYPRFPMVLKNIKGCVVINILAQRKFVNDIGIVEAFKKAGGNPRLRDR